MGAVSTRCPPTCMPTVPIPATAASTCGCRRDFPAATVKLRARINASSGTELLAFQGYSSEATTQLGATVEPVEIDLDDLGNGNGTMFYPFTTTLIQIKLNREPLPMDKVSRLLTFLDS